MREELYQYYIIFPPSSRGYHVSSNQSPVLQSFFLPIDLKNLYYELLSRRLYPLDLDLLVFINLEHYLFLLSYVK